MYQDREGSFLIRGVVEGFYGRPWSMVERKHLVTTLVPKGLNHYIYAPKDEPKHRTKWRDQYSRQEQDEFQDFINFLADKGVAFNFAISPGSDFNFHDERGFRADIESMALKYTTMVQLGCKNLTLLMDDVSSDGGDSTQGEGKQGKKKLSPGEAQVKLCEELNKRVNELVKERVEKAPPRLQWHFFPTHYCGDFQGLTEDVDTDNKKEGGAKGKRNELKDSSKTSRKKLTYWREIARLPPSWIFFFTGTSQVSPTVTTHFGMALQRFWKKRKLILWDNFPVNDYRPQIRNLHAYEGREAGLKDFFEGVVANPMEQLESSLLPLYTVFDYLNNPVAYDPQQSLKNSLIDSLFGSQLANDMQALIQCAPPSPLRSQVALDALRKTQLREGKKYFVDLLASLDKIIRFLNDTSGEKNEAKARRKKALSEELQQFFVLQRLYLEMNICTHELNDALGSSAVDSLEKVATKKTELTRIQRQLEVLLFPSRPAKLLREKMEELNKEFCV